MTEPKKKNNHFVPRSYLVRFKSLSSKQISLYNIKNSLTIKDAPIKSQCSRDYFYTKNPVFENEFRKIEDTQKRLLDTIITEGKLPEFRPDSENWHDLLACVMFQAGRTASQVVHADHLLNQFGKAMLRFHFEQERNTELLEYLPQVTLATNDAVLESIQHHLTMYPLISDLECTLVHNKTSEDFLTSDHPVALCNSIPSANPQDAPLGFASRGLIVVYPISPRALLVFSDPEVYRVTSLNRCLNVYRSRDVIELNLMQFGNAYENVYFSDPARVRHTLDAFRRRAAVLRPPPRGLTESAAVMPDRRRRVLLQMEPATRRLSLPRGMDMKWAARAGKFQIGDALVRNPFLVQLVSEESKRMQGFREAATAQAEREGIGEIDEP